MKESKPGVINSTINFKIFKTKKGNRDVSDRAVLSLVRSIEKKNMLAVNPIIVNKRMEVIDGQHRIKAAQILNTPIYYVVFDPASLVEIQLLNVNMKKWVYKDFLNSYIELGKKDYILFNEFKNKYNFPFGATIRILGSIDFGKDKDAHRRFNDGRFVVEDIRGATEIAERIVELQKYVHDSVKGSSRFFDAVLMVLKHHEEQFDRIIEKLAGTGVKIYRTDVAREYLVQFEAVLNKGRVGKPIRLY